MQEVRRGREDYAEARRGELGKREKRWKREWKDPLRRLCLHLRRRYGGGEFVDVVWFVVA